MSCIKGSLVLKATWFLLLLVPGLLLVQSWRSASATRAAAAEESASLNARADQVSPVALIKAIVFNGAPSTQDGDQKSFVTRVSSSNEAAESGQLLFPGDELITGPRVQCTILFLGNAPDINNEVLVDANSRVRVGSIFDWLGRIVVRVKGAFETKTEKVNLGVQGTEFELVVNGAGTNTMTVLEGVVTVEKGSFTPSASNLPLDFLPQESSTQTTAPRDRSFIKSQQSAAHVKRPFSQGPRVEAGKLEQVTVTADDLSKQGATPEGIRQTVVWSNEVIIASHQTYTTQSVMPHFVDLQEQAKAFRAARLNAILRSNVRAYEVLGNAYLDWGDAGKALDAYGKTRRTSLESTPDFWTNQGEAYRLAGHASEAETAFNLALKLDSNLAPALNGLGNLYLDQAKAERDKRQFGLAVELLNKARDFYARASMNMLAERSHYQRRPPNPANAPLSKVVVQANIGEVYRTWGDVAQDQRKDTEAVSFYQESERRFKDAQQLAPDYPFIHTGLGSIYREINKIAAAKDNKTVAAEAYKNAETEFSRAIEGHRDLAAAYVGLGNLYENAGGKEAAINFYTKATQRRPEEPNGHYYLAMALAERNPRLAAAHANAYLNLAPAPQRQGEKANNALRLAHKVGPRSTATPTPTPTSRPTPISTPGLVKVPGVKGDKPDDAVNKIQKAGLATQLESQPDCDASGRVLGTDPAKDQKVERGTTVTVFVSSAGENPAIVPGVKGLSQFDAEERLREAGLVSGRTRTREADARPGTVLSQNPNEGKALRRGCAVELTLAIAIPLVEVPNYIGHSREEALQQLQRYVGDLVRGNVIEVDSDQPDGTVVDQNPKPYARVRRGTSVNLYIARSNLVLVPDVRGHPEREAVQMLERSGLRVGRISRRPGGSQGLVIEQSVTPNRRVPPGTQVDLVISYIIG